MAETRERLKEISHHLQRLEEVFHRTAIGEELQMIAPMLNAMSVTSASLNMKPGMAPLFFSLCLSTVGTDEWLGKELQAGIEQISKETENPLLIKKVATAIILGSIAAGHLIGKNETLFCELAFLMMASSGLIRSTIHELMTACEAAESATDVLTLASYVLFIEASKQKSLWETAQSYLIELLAKTENAFEGLPAIAIAQARMALEQGKPEELPELLNKHLPGLTKDLAAISKMAETIYDSCAIDFAPHAEINVVA